MQVRIIEYEEELRERIGNSVPEQSQQSGCWGCWCTIPPLIQAVSAQENKFRGKNRSMEGLIVELRRKIGAKLRMREELQAFESKRSS